MIIITHPYNARYLTEIKEEVSRSLTSQGITAIKGSLYDIPIVFEDAMPKDKFSHYEGKEEKFVSHGTSDWEIYFGFVKKIRVPLFYLVEKRNSVVWSGK